LHKNCGHHQPDFIYVAALRLDKTVLRTDRQTYRQTWFHIPCIVFDRQSVSNKAWS